MEEALPISLAGVSDRDDAELARAATEDRAAFAAIYERHRTPVYRYLRARTATDADAQDLTATTFERAMGAIHRFRPVGGGMVAWLIPIARNAHSDALRQQRRRGTEATRDAAEPAIDPSDDAVVLRSLIDGLPRAQRDAIQLRFAAGLTAREIGGVLGISEAAAQKQVERGLHAREGTGGAMATASTARRTPQGHRRLGRRVPPTLGGKFRTAGRLPPRHPGQEGVGKWRRR